MKIEYCCEKCGKKYTEKAACEAHEAACMSIAPVELMGWHDLRYTSRIGDATRPTTIFVRYGDGLIGEYGFDGAHAAECEEDLNIHYMPKQEDHNDSED